MTDQQTINGESRSDEDQTFLDPDEQTTDTQASDQKQKGSGQEQKKPKTAQEAWDYAVAAMDAEQTREYRQQTAMAARAGLPSPPPPGYNPPATPTPADQAQQNEQTAADLQDAIEKAQAAGDWNKTATLKGQLLNLAKRQGLTA